MTSSSRLDPEEQEAVLSWAAAMGLPPSEIQVAKILLNPPLSGNITELVTVVIRNWSRTYTSTPRIVWLTHVGRDIAKLRRRLR